MVQLVINYWLCRPRGKGIALLVGDTCPGGFLVGRVERLVPRLSAEDGPAKLEVELEFQS